MQFALSKDTRLLAVAPHPDDESLATGGLLSAAVNVGASVRVIYLTNGDNNPWPQRAMERRWRIGAEDRARWGHRRQTEALAALESFGVPPEMVDFLDYPDQGITSLLMQGDNAPAERLAVVLASWRPTLLVAPGLADIHPDHNAAAVFVRQAMAGLNTGSDMLWMEYLVHARRRPLPSCSDICLPMSPEERGRKRAAISCHKTQILLRPRRLFAYADRDERFAAVPGISEPVHPYHPLSHCHWRGGVLHLRLATASFPRTYCPLTLCIAGNHQGRTRVRTTINLPCLPRTESVEIVDAYTSNQAGYVRSDGDARQAVIVFENTDWGSVDQLFVKVERSFGFFDEAGWTIIDPSSKESIL